MNNCAQRGSWRRAVHCVLTLAAALVPGPRDSFAASSGGMSNVQTVFIIVMENNGWPVIKGNTNAPYLNNTLLPLASYCENYHNVPGIHPSLPNYLWLEAGTGFGITDDHNPAINHQNTTNHLATLLDKAAISWKSYQEDISGTVVPLTDVNGYAPKHNPFVYFDDLTGTNNLYWPYGIAHNRPYTEFPMDLTNNAVARYNFITPNICNDMHDNCYPVFNGIRQGDNWLAKEVPRILGSQAYYNNGALFITWDESYDVDTRIGMIVLSPLARGGGYTNTIYYTHSSMLRSLQEIFGVGPFLGGATNATNLSDLFRPPSVTPPGFRISHIASLGSNVVQLTATGVTTNSPLILQWSSNLTAWASISTNPSPPATCLTCVTNDAATSSLGYYRLMQWLP